MIDQNFIMNYFKVQLKVPKSPLVLRRSICTSIVIPEVIVYLIDLVYKGWSITYLYLIVDIHLDRDYIERYRVVLSRLFISIEAANLEMVILL